jgi:hypothetical protein
MTMDTSDGEGHHVAVVGSAVNASGAVSTTIHGDARSPMGLASTTAADNSRLLSTLQRSSSHDAQSLLFFRATLYSESHAACAFSYVLDFCTSQCVPASVSVALCCPHVACTAPLLLCPHPATSMHFPVTFISCGKHTVLSSCLHAPYLWPQRQSEMTLRVTVALLAVAVVACGAVVLEEGFHHDIDETVITVSAYHACALTPVPGVEFGGKAVCWGNKKFNRLATPDVRPDGCCVTVCVSVFHHTNLQLHVQTPVALCCSTVVIVCADRTFSFKYHPASSQPVVSPRLSTSAAGATLCSLRVRH